MINMSSSSSTDPYASSSHFFSFPPLQPHTTWDPNPAASAAIAAATANSSFNLTYTNFPSLLSNSSYLDYAGAPTLAPLTAFPYAEHSVKSEEELGLSAVGLGRIGLNLGHRTYFSSGDAAAIDRLFSRSRGVYALAHQPPRCQAEGCKANLSGAKHYHRRHKVCEFHSKAAVVIAGGLQQRFCQQCSRFHVLSEFDEAKRSCRKRLADHNRRRRKPQPQPLSSKSHTTNSSSEKSKHPTKSSTKLITTGSKVSNGTSGMSSVSKGLEGQQGYQNKASQLRSGPALSLGEAGVFATQDLYQNQLPLMAQQQQEQLQHNFSSSTSSSSTYFHHHNLFCSSSIEASQSTGGGSDHHHHHQQQQQQQGQSLLHLGQAAMFEVDFM